MNHYLLQKMAFHPFALEFLCPIDLLLNLIQDTKGAVTAITEHSHTIELLFWEEQDNVQRLDSLDCGSWPPQSLTGNLLNFSSGERQHWIVDSIIVSDSPYAKWNLKSLLTLRTCSWTISTLSDDFITYIDKRICIFNCPRILCIPICKCQRLC